MSTRTGFKGTVEHFTVMVLLVAGMVFWVSVSSAGESVLQDTQADTVAELFQKEGIDGTFVLASSNGTILHVYNNDRAEQRFSPASTFKIFNTLIALDAGVVTSATAKFKWDGKDRGVPAWNRDQTLRSAYKVSCVWCYQQLARAIGLDRYNDALSDKQYGNQTPGEQVDLFWLNGDLQISAIEQLKFLEQLSSYSIAYRREHIDALKSIMLDEATVDYSIYAKTGWTGPELQVGWYIGYIEKGSDTWLFAMNMRMDNLKQAPLRKKLTIMSLQALGVL